MAEEPPRCHSLGMTKRFRQFCDKTTLHGWAYLPENSILSWRTGLWACVVAVVHGLAAVFIALNTKQYLQATVQTTLESTSTSLSDVLFPSVTICNINQFEASFMNDINVYNNLTQMMSIYNVYVSGIDSLEKLRPILDDIAWLRDKDLLYNTSIQQFSHQACRSLIVSAEFQSTFIDYTDVESSNLGISAVGTDFGMCCQVTPQLISVARDARGLDIARNFRLRDIGPGSKNGDSNGVRLVLNIENFNFAYHRESSQGLKVVVHDPTSKSIVEHNGILIETGRHTQIGIHPVLTRTSEDAVSRLDASERQCYADGEVDLKYLSAADGHTYDMQNCLFNFAIHRILKECECRPHFLPSLESSPLDSNKRPFCVAEAIRCMDNILGDISGDRKRALVIGGDDDESSGRMCYPKCSRQTNHLQLSSSSFPQSRNFYLQRHFCLLARSLLTRECTNTKRIFLDAHYPGLCLMIADRARYVSNCTSWPFTYLWDNVRNFLDINETESGFFQTMQAFASENLAQVTLAVKCPNVQTISRDLKMTFTSFVSQSGGILGLCLGFSIVSMVELVYLCLLHP